MGLTARTLLSGLSSLAAAGVVIAASNDDLVTANTGPKAFAQPFAFIEGEALAKFRSGADLFGLPWFAQSEAQGRFGGLGPLSNRFSCAGCHIGNGRGETSANEADVMRSTLVRLSVPGTGEGGAPLPEPTYGDQLQPTGIYGVLGEGEASIRWHELEHGLGDGARVSLRRPELVLSRLHYGPVASGTMTSIRMAPAVFGMGLLAAVPDEELMALADPDDADHDGIRGRLNHVWNVQLGRVDIGRFGLKANQPTLRQQVAAALIGDMGITSRLFMQQNCTQAEEACARAPSGRAPEIDDDDLATLVAYVAGIAPPARRGAGTASQRGEDLFRHIGCASCHRPNLTTGADGSVPQASRRMIHPYTDLLLHDMGEVLSDGRPDYEASGRDWRTAPLWGIGLARALLEQPTYLHDGRARTLMEAILWHGGEAARARNAYAALNDADRNAILAFLNSL
jgi:CxxC motif-containing protein (DUF1111 family)